MPVRQVYSIWFNRLCQLLPAERKTRVRNMAWLLEGLFEAQSIHLGRVALKIPLPIQRASIERRLSRFLHNAAVRVRAWYRPVAQALLQPLVAAGQKICLVLDTTHVHSRAQLVLLGLTFRRRVLPLVWTWVPKGRGHSSSLKQRALLGHIWPWIPKGAAVSVVSDNEFGSVALMQQLEAWGWDYVLRQKGSTLVHIPELGYWTALEELVTGPGQSTWYEGVLLTGAQAHRCNLLIHWEPDEKDP